MEGFKVLSPSYGPSKASIRLEKDDESLTAYHFKAFYNNKRKLLVFVNFGDSYTIQRTESLISMKNLGFYCFCAIF